MADNSCPADVRERWALCALIALVCLLIPIRRVAANDLQITNLWVHPHSGGNGEVEFDVTWRNSWRSTTEPYNWDAAWIFCKIRRNGGDWTHLKLSTTGHTIPSTPQAITTALGLVDPTIAHNATTNPAVGIFLHRTNDGYGTFTANDVRLRWNYSDNGASSGDVIEIRVVGIEMVYIPQAAFYAGDGPTDLSTNAFREGISDLDPWHITSESAITTTDGNSGNYYYLAPNNGCAAAGVPFTIPAEYPKGFAAFYMMKGEISQSQWVAFFNMLTATQKTERDITGNHTDFGGKNSDSVVDRNSVSWTSGDATATWPTVAMNYIAWDDLIAYLDWSGLRLMTELEFEKAGRGPKTPVALEYAWGSTTATLATTINNSGLSNERAQTGANLAANGNVAGPLRVGSFSSGVDTREASGGGFYGVMELSGNLWERVVSVCPVTPMYEGRYHGDGVLSSGGAANVTTWPFGVRDVYNQFIVSGGGRRGGSYYYVTTRARLSSRFIATDPQVGRRGVGSDSGGRGVRTAP